MGSRVSLTRDAGNSSIDVTVGFESIVTCIGGSLEPKAIPLMHLEESVLLQYSDSPT
jgi:hypothetical protein